MITPTKTKAARVFQPSHYESFRCIGAECEDNCCAGWSVHIDKATYGKYQASADPMFGSKLNSLININPKSVGDDDYAAIALNEATCPFLSDRICSIQQRLGEGYLSNMCATYPRVINQVDDVLQRSLDLSCPGAARTVLLNRRPIEFEDMDFTDGSIRAGSVPSLDTSGMQTSAEPFGFFRDIQRIVVSLLQDRSYSIWKRLLLVGSLCEKLEETGSQGWNREAPAAIQRHLDNLRNGQAGEPQAICSVDPKLQLETVLDLIVARITSDANPRRFLECYKEFMEGIQWTSKSTLSEMGDRYSKAFSEHYAPFIATNEHMLENYLVNYAHRTLFPFGVPESNHRLRDPRVPSLVTARYMLMVGYYAITQTLLIGTAGFHKRAFGASHALKAIQSCTKTFEHSTNYPTRLLGMLAEKGMTTPASLSVLTRN